MSKLISCECGYQGMGMVAGLRMVCPMCSRTAAQNTFPAESKAVVNPAHLTASSQNTAGIFQIPCPRGHLLKMPTHLLEQQVVCPKCDEFFIARKADSIESRAEADRLEQQRSSKLASRWLMVSIAMAGLVITGLLIMIGLSTINNR